ncbi:MAG TPA: DUF1015 family protein [Mycobacteriales bacterium]
MTSPFLQPIPRAWVATGPYGAPNYDELATCDDVRALDAAHPRSVLRVDLPQCFSDRSFLASLPSAVRALQDMKDDGRYAPVADALLLYAMDDARAVVGLVRTDEISDGPDQPGRLLRNEEVFADKVAERRAHLEALHHLVSAVLLVPEDGPACSSALERAFDGVGDPLVTEVDERGVTHRVWLAADPAALQEVLDRQVFLVADGNHRSLAAQQAGFGVCLAVVADPVGLRIAAYHRLLLLGLTGAELVEKARQAGFAPAPVTELDPRDNHLVTAEGSFRLALTGPDDPVGRLPHSVVESDLFAAVLGIDPAGEHVRYDADAGALVAEVHEGRATGAILLRPVTTDEFVAVNAARLQMPRKSTWFLPKARAGLFLAQL